MIIKILYYIDLSFESYFLKYHSMKKKIWITIHIEKRYDRRRIHHHNEIFEWLWKVNYDI